MTLRRTMQKPKCYFTTCHSFKIDVFSILQIVVNRGGCVDKIARYAIAFIIATNLCIWYHTLIVETKEDIIANNRASNTYKNQPSPVVLALAATNFTLSTQNYDKGENNLTGKLEILVAPSVLERV